MKPKTPTQQAEHFAWIDNAKAVLIFLIVLGHLHYAYAPVPGKDIIYAFHVPAFLFITGFLLPKDFDEISLSGLTQKWLAPYLRAYVFFSALALVIWWAAICLKAGHLVSPLPGLLGVLYGVAGSDNFFHHQNQPLWYFTFLMVSLIGARVCVALPRQTDWVLAAALFAFATVYEGPRLPWNLDVGGAGVLAVLFGHRLRRNWSFLKQLFAPPSHAVAMLALGLFILVAMSDLNGTTNINGREFGHSGLLYVLGMTAGFCTTLALGILIPAKPLLSRISAETLTIFALHFYFVRAAGRFVPRPENRWAQLAVMICLSLAIIVACLYLARLLRPVLDRVVFLRSRRKPRSA